MTAYDIHETLFDILNMEQNSHYSSKKGKSIFKNINVEKRNCIFYKKEIDSQWCRCINYEYKIIKKYFFLQIYNFKIFC